jgi:hypothetical protein
MDGDPSRNGTLVTRIKHRQILALGLLLTVGTVAGADTASPWHPLADGLELARFDAGRGAISVLRVDPARWQTVALAASALDGQGRSARQWGRAHDLVAVINAGMFAADRLTHTGYFRTGEHVNNGLWNRRDYRQVACFEPHEPGWPPFALFDLDVHSETTVADAYDVVVQNLRLIKKPGENRWSPQDRRWVEACLGEDSLGRMLWIFSHTAHSMHDLNAQLLALPLDLVAAQHLEGGPGAQLWIDPALLAPLGDDDSLAENLAGSAWAVPNVLGLRPRGPAAAGDPTPTP